MNTTIERKSIKAKNCRSCYNLIEIGEKEIEVKGEDDGYFWTLYFHKNCFGVRRND